MATLFFSLTGFLLGQSEYKSYQLSVDFAGEGKPQNIYWNNTGFTPGDLLLDKDMQLTLDYFSAIPNARDKSYIRPHWLLNLIESKNVGFK